MQFLKLAVVGILGASAVAGCGGGNGNGLSTPTNTGTIAFVSDRDDFSKFFAMDADGKNVRLLNIANSPPQANNSYPRFSYDGRKIAFICNNNVCLMNADGTGRRQITRFSSTSSDEGFLVPGAPSLSPDGQELVFAFETPDPILSNNEIWKINVNGSGLKRLTTNTRDDTHPVWSPDGQSIASEVVDESRLGSQIRIIDKDGKNERILTSPQTGAFDPAFSPDGKRIAFFNSGRSDVSIAIMDVDGKNLRPITKLINPLGSGLAFSSDGRALVFSDGRNVVNNVVNQEIYTIGIDGKNERRLTDDLAVDTQPAWG